MRNRLSCFGIGPYYCRRNPSSLSMRSLQTAERPHGPVIYKDLIALTYTTNRSQEGPFWGEVALPSVESERRVVPPPIQGVIRHRGGPLMPLGRPWRRGVPDERGQHRSPQSPSGACPTTTPSARAQMRSTIRCGTPSEAGGHAPSKRVGVVPIIVDGVGVGLAIDQRPARVWDPKDVPEGEHRRRSLNRARFGGAKATGQNGYQCSSEAIGARCVAVPELLRVEEGPCIRGDELPL